jgi:hypothetical protein
MKSFFKQLAATILGIVICFTFTVGICLKLYNKQIQQTQQITSPSILHVRLTGNLITDGINSPLFEDTVELSEITYALQKAEKDERRKKNGKYQFKKTILVTSGVIPY